MNRLKGTVVMLSLSAVALFGAAAALAPAANAVPAAVTVSGPFSVTPSTGSPETMHFRATFDTGSWNYRAVVQCSNSNILLGGWKTFGSGDTSNTPSCSASGDGNAVAAQFDYRQSAPIRIGCWVNGQSRSGTCHN